ncbi:GNAT family N-acetyltransferase [Roseovarius sp. BRH_c41]|uniref:GNAT family N-acetyltransferase n=1 Tax=Roseovarius sp. BRH_c41 TaxID=1629709 RepID=UPI0005F1E270|nr:GNAT family N-acetyltransferase [Roseovarius sp. BRH_c41]KJS41113.1 MAG: alanine acetyltransferase [Roseovarius sp. BRH_c41]
MTPETLATCHARAFAGSGRAWTAPEFAGLLESSFVFTVGDARAFLLGRVIADEAEVLTLATDPAYRRLGLARQCLAAFEDAARTRSAGVAFLEVAEDNAAALPLYLGAGFAEAARRAGYYTRANGTKIDALILTKALD